MASLFLSVLGRAEKLRSRVADLFSSSPSTSSFPSSSTSSSKIARGLENLCRRMQRIRALLSDAENREITDSGVKFWLEELRDVGYDAEDLIEDVEYELMRSQLLCKEARRQEEQILSKINKINERFNHIYEDRCKLELREEDGQRCGAAVLETPARMPSSCLVDVQGVHGREDDKSEVIKKLLSDVDQVHGHCKENVRVVSIVGMGGLGKTTLAQLVYNDNLVENHFELRLWVCVSDQFDVIRLTKAILEEIEKTPNQLEQFNSVQETLFKKLRGKRYLLVLDDVWNENYRHWEALWVSLSSGAKWSRVLITTRSEKVSKICRVNEENMYRLGCLSDEDSWLLFEQWAFGGMDSGDYPNLVEIGQEIVRKCKGQPLTLKTLAGLLFCESGEDRWEDILKSELWELPEGEDHVLPILKLSYYHLPSSIKPCFAYCAVFPKDYIFYRDQLVWMWMAQGYINSTASRCMEDVGIGYFEFLLQRSFFQKTNEVNRQFAFEYNILSDCFIMHDLIHDLACYIWRGECCEAKDGGVSNGRARHLRFTGEVEDEDKDMRSIVSCVPTEILKRMRTCLLTRIRLDSYVWQSDVDDMFSRMKYLRVLHVTDSNIKKLPNSIGTLMHLRYLHIRSWWLDELPESLGNLHNLQTLEVESQEFVNLPESIGEVANLRHLWLGRHVMPHGIGRLTKMRWLPLFVVGNGIDDAGIEELMGLNDLQGDLTIFLPILNSSSNYNSKNNDNIDNQIKKDSGGGHDDGKEARCNILKNKQGLESLTLVFPPYHVGGQQTNYIRQQEEELLETLQPHVNLKHLTIQYYTGGRFPKWVGDPSYLRLERMCLMSCVSCQQLSVGRDEGGVLPRLRELEIKECSELKYVKLRHLTALTTLTISRCGMLTTLDYYDDRCVSSSSDQLQPPQEEAIYYSHIPSLKRMDIHGSASLDQQHWVESHRDKLPRNLTMLYYSSTTLARNVVDFKEASAIFSSYLLPLKELKLEWDQRILSTPAEAERVLSKLCPLRCPEYLLIQGYQGRCFPNWAGDPKKLSDVKELTLSDCVNCELLPPLGLLPVLQQLHISNMPRWEECQLLAVNGGEFRNLWELRIDNCPMLSKMHISGLRHLRGVFITNLLALEELLVTNCRELISVNGLQSLPSLQILAILDCPRLYKMHISDLPALRSVFITNLLALGELLVTDCRKLVSVNSLHGLPSLQILSITGCPRLVTDCRKLVSVNSLCTSMSCFSRLPMPPSQDQNASDGEGSCSDVVTSDWLTLGRF